jgi:predicted DNA-binding transcriptional regulator YafY
MVEVEILNENAYPEPEDFHVVDFIRKVFEMFDGEEETVTLECENTLMKVIIDRFGEEVDTERISQDKFRVKVLISTSRTFYGWVFQFGGQIKIVGPDKVKKEYIDMARAAIE